MPPVDKEGRRPEGIVSYSSDDERYQMGSDTDAEEQGEGEEEEQTSFISITDSSVGKESFLARTRILTDAQDINLTEKLYNESETTIHNEYLEHDSNLFEVRPSDVGGFGAFATKDLKRGTVILRERPLFIAAPDNLQENFDALDDNAKSVALSLHSHVMNRTAGVPTIKGVWLTNWYNK